MVEPGKSSGSSNGDLESRGPVQRRDDGEERASRHVLVNEKVFFEDRAESEERDKVGVAYKSQLSNILSELLLREVAEGETLHREDGAIREDGSVSGGGDEMIGGEIVCCSH